MSERPQVKDNEGISHTTRRTKAALLAATEAPKPWRVRDWASDTKGYISVVDASDNRVCDLFPFAGVGGRGKEATLALARQIVEAVND